MENQKKHVAIVLAGGKGSRMGADKPKQYMEIAGKPMLYYSLKAFQDSFVDEIVLVTGEGEQEYCKQEIVDANGITKVSAIVTGGKERYDSVYNGLSAIDNADYVYIHDGARPFLTQEILERAKACVMEYGACVAGMPVKDTIKIVDAQDMVIDTPNRKYVWQVQTPQVFGYNLVKKAYDLLGQKSDKSGVTDDAMVVETMLGHPVKLFEASYENIKITTPEDMLIGEKFLKKHEEC